MITHGTDTIAKTAEALDRTVEGKTVVITGAMLPEKFVTSDARFNIGMAAAAVQTLSSGVYVALYGCVVPWRDFQALNTKYEEVSKKIVTQGTDFAR